MRVPRILALQVTREILVYMVLGFVAVVVLLASQNLLQRLDQLTMVGIPGTDLLAVMGGLLPMLASYAMPIALVFGTLLALQRMRADGEILAMRSCGIGLGPIAIPALALGLVATALCAWMILSVEHEARARMMTVFKRAATKGGILEPGRFRVIGDRLVFVDARDRRGGLEGVMIADYSNPARPLRIFAERGRLVFDEEADRLRFELFSGDVHIAPVAADPRDDRRLAFEELAYAVDVGSLMGRAFSPTRPRQMSLDELRSVLARAASGDPLFGLDQRDPVEYAMEIQRRFALPLAPLLFVLAAVPLGVRSSRGGRAWGVLLCGVLVGAYYALIGSGQMLARAGVLDPSAALWLPTALFGGVGIVLFVRAWRGGAS